MSSGNLMPAFQMAALYPRCSTLNRKYELELFIYYYTTIGKQYIYEALAFFFKRVHQFFIFLFMNEFGHIANYMEPFPSAEFCTKRMMPVRQ